MSLKFRLFGRYTDVKEDYMGENIVFVGCGKYDGVMKYFNKLYFSEKEMEMDLKPDKKEMSHLPLKELMILRGVNLEANLLIEKNLPRMEGRKRKGVMKWIRKQVYQY